MTRKPSVEGGTRARVSGRPERRGATCLASRPGDSRAWAEVHAPGLPALTGHERDVQGAGWKLGQCSKEAFTEGGDGPAQQNEARQEETVAQ